MSSLLIRESLIDEILPHHRADAIAAKHRPTWSRRTIQYESERRPWQAQDSVQRPSFRVSRVEAFRTKADDALIASPIELAETLLEINNLAFEDEEDQFGPIRPTYHAFKQCMKVILGLALDGRLIKPSDITTDHNGDIRISWAQGDRETELVCPSDGQPYIYFGGDESYGSIQDLATNKIDEKVRWAMDGK